MVDVNHFKYDLSSSFFGQENGTQHRPIISVSGHYDPSFEFYPRCSCGWMGISIEEDLTNDLKNSIIPPAQALVEEYGAKVLLSPHSAFGDYADAVRLVLEHIEYDHYLDLALRVEEFSETKRLLTSSISKLPLDEEDHALIKDLSERINKNSHNLLEARMRGEVFLERSPLENQHIPELYALREKKYQEYFNRGETPPF